MGSGSVVQCVRHLMGQPLYCSAVDAGNVGRDAMLMAPHPKGDSAVSPCFHGCPAFLHRHFPPQSPPSYPLDLSLHSQQQTLSWDCSTIPKLQLPACRIFQETCVPVWDLYGYSKDCLTLIPFRLPQISCFTLHLKCFSSESDNCPDVGIGPLLQFSH